MMMRHPRFYIFVALLSCVLGGLHAIEIPRDHVFVFERNTNTNYVCYDVNLRDGRLVEREPLKTYWVLGNETRIEALTFLDRKMAFGVKVLSQTEDEAVVHLSAYKALTIRICRRKGKWVGIVRMNGKEIIVKRMFAQMKQPMYVKCEWVDIYGTDAKTGAECRERIKP